ncbi:hypothetical protein H112_03077 [Trichophyton rubrum D6]|uniref:Uncharacterized protein n=4 Tax=Trichophyton TaxID=5550 RepID=A0A178EVD5_TRIRU|nr:uncharacterized protein TERG_05695 [Trichophyton rubrum CBS 118892]EZF24394.1 hypothetical protein H100_03083 [Trichophyton rubrum MR850]EZF43434.1 hypothetical protein H102_03076 [Trichophyton rubrum CBS 100081]EZF54002.1 hypothetical protein H103_03090 [Trichophyton rubrum CBS 288.86]EZF64776.1 hypothetical protein H104_03070 [Trichophyton rubrum CBS 289.86]EZF75317.1 hypothetical protein H105_03094 [Trichophyton soudanense CBS 452.61]EZF85907.1 hypothetical protein H110_03083 [Trichophy
MPAMSSEADVIFNRANVALARSQRLIASWLPPKTADETANAKSEEELQKEEDEIFTAVPEKLGLGAPIPQKEADGSIKRTELSSNDKLRKQLLGKNFQKAEASRLKNASTRTKQTGPTPSQKNELVEESEEEDGRSALGKGKKGKNSSDQSPAASGADPGGKKRASSYLDEVLSRRKSKKGRI